MLIIRVYPNFQKSKDKHISRPYFLKTQYIIWII